MYKNYLKVAIRHLWKNKSVSAINIIGLATGLAVCVLIVLFVLVLNDGHRDDLVEGVVQGLLVRHEGVSQMRVRGEHDRVGLPGAPLGRGEVRLEGLDQGLQAGANDRWVGHREDGTGLGHIPIRVMPP